MAGGWLSVFICLCAYGDTARILIVVPTPSISHQVVFRPIAQELAKHHRVVILTTDPAFRDQASPNLTEVDLHDISYAPWIDRFIKTASGKRNDLYTQIDTAFDLILEIFPKQIKSEATKKVFDKEKFDLVIAEAWPRSVLALSHVFKAPVILMSSLGGLDENYQVMGAPVNPILYPDFLRTRIFNLTLWEKVTELYNRYLMYRLMMLYQEKEDAMLRDLFGEDMPPLEELKNNVELLMVNIDPVFEGYRPVPPNVIHLGSLNCAPSKDLPQDLQSWMDSSKHGVIYMSFGTNTDPSLLPPERMAVFVRVFRALPYDVLWKWKEPPAGLPDNVRTAEWLPQSDLLRHKKLVLFITQAGLQSTDEAIRAGVPLLAFPMLGDQWFNAEQYERLRVGRRLELALLTDDQLKDNIEEIIKDQGYRTRSKLLSEEMLDRPESSLERAIWWIERTLRRRTRQRAPAVSITWLTFIDGDIIVAALAMFVCLVAALLGLYKVFTRSVKVKTA
ncbi:UDP-glucosyltransferase 2-like [Leguminivora glycinivorella]|uniref:UDP-glucosyltransferase 2-like n=1 Tax=Leguminivora glycinivorella TaxID=1035111 RepID=UPI00200F39D3|nr:UDP-glucosyltransferase 2-like [Leguminivora glycinivorella]